MRFSTILVYLSPDNECVDLFGHADMDHVGLPREGGPRWRGRAPAPAASSPVEDASISRYLKGKISTCSLIFLREKCVKMTPPTRKLSAFRFVKAKAVRARASAGSLVACARESHEVGRNGAISDDFGVFISQ